MKVSFFETGRYVAPPDMPREWPVPAGAYDPEIGARAYQDMVERVRFVEELGFDWISVSEHHYSPRILTPSPVVSAAFLAAQTSTIKISLLGPIVPTSNPIRIAEEFAMLDTMAPGRLVFGMLRGTTNEYLSYDLNPIEARERTDEGMELILKAWNEPQPFGCQGGYSQYRTVAGERRAANVGGVLPISFCGGADRVVEQLRRCREEMGAGVVDLSLADPGTGDVDAMMRSLELFGTKVLPRIRDI